jgi:membrane-associated phospholipid phosphatase
LPADHQSNAILSPAPNAGQAPRLAGLRVPATIGGVGLVLFCILAAALVGAGPTNVWDLRLDAALRSVRNPVADDLMFTATYLCSWQVIVAGLLLAMTYMFVVRRRLVAAALLVSVLGDQAIVSTLKNLFQRTRPDQLLALLPATGPSFPSGHTFAAIAFYGALAVLVAEERATHRAWLAFGLPAGIFVAAVGLSRVYLGAHWPSDVVGSWLLGIAWLCLVLVGLRAARRRFPKAPERGP